MSNSNSPNTRFRFSDRLTLVTEHGHTVIVNNAPLANEAEKAANITLVNYTPRGRSGRLYFSGSDAEVRQARDAAIKAIEALPGRTK